MKLNELIKELQDLEKYGSELPVMITVDNDRDIISISYQNWPSYVDKDGEYVTARIGVFIGITKDKSVIQ